MDGKRNIRWMLVDEMVGWVSQGGVRYRAPYGANELYMTRMSKLHKKRVKACEIYGKYHKKEGDGESERH